MELNWGKICKIPQTFQDHICGPQNDQQKMVSICFPYLQNKMTEEMYIKISHNPKTLHSRSTNFPTWIWHRMNVREGRVAILYTLINSTSPEVPQRPIYVNVRQSIKTNLNLFLPLCNYSLKHWTGIWLIQMLGWT